MTISQLDERFETVQGNIEKVHKDNIAQIRLDKAEAEEDGTSNGGTISLQTNGGADVPDSITVTSTGGENGEDVAIEFSNSITTTTKDENGKESTTTTTSFFTVDAGSKVVANEVTDNDGADTLTSLTINGVNYLVSSGTTYTAGDGITISDDDKISVDIDENSNLRLEEGKLTASDYRLVGANVAEDGENPDYSGVYTVDENGDIVLNVVDSTTGDVDTVTIEGVASADALDSLTKRAVKYDLDNDGNVDHTHITLEGDEYSYDSATKTAEGGTLIMNVAYAQSDKDANDYVGSATVNVDLLNDTVTTAVQEIEESSYKGWNISANGKDSEAVESGDTVDFSSKDGNVTVTKTPGDEDEIVLSFGLANSININSSVTVAGTTVMDKTGFGFTNNSSSTVYYITESGLNANNQTISNVKAGEADTDAVNVGQLNTAISEVKQEVTVNDQHLVANPDSEDGSYSVENNTVGLQVQTGYDEDGNPTYNTVTIDNIAQADDLGDVSQLNDDLKNTNENNEYIATSVVDAINNLDDKVGSGDFSETKYAKNTDEAGEYPETSVTDAIINLDEAIGSLQDDVNSAKNEASKHSTVSDGNGINVTQSKNENGSTNYEVSLADEFTLGNAKGTNVSISGTDGTVSVTNGKRNNEH